ncbi:hypothetical protein [Amycolatopsis acidiphila]|nr:hypothetical protein GCM10017788_58550 [Amycolatopsis acidiphila]
MDDSESLAQAAVADAAHKFLLSAAGDGGLLRAWPLVDPTLRICLAQLWVHANRGPITRLDFDFEEVAAALAKEGPGHRLWSNFETVTVRALRKTVYAGIGDNPENWGIASAPRLIDVETKLLYVHDVSKLPGAVWESDTYSIVVPMVMRLTDGEWRVLNVGSDVVPEPGWPPRLRH